MSTVLAVYSITAFHEFFLPAIRNTDYSVAIDSGLFSIPRSIVLSLENIDGQWYINSEDRKLFTEAGATAHDEELVAGKLFRIGPSKRTAWASIIVSEIRDFIVGLGAQFDVGGEVSNCSDFQHGFISPSVLK